LKKGDKFVCKLSFITSQTKGMLFTLKKISNNGGLKYTLICDDLNEFQVKINNLYTHFYTKKELRKQKLQKLKNLNI